MKSNCLARARSLLGGILLLAAGMLALRMRNGVETDLYALADTAHGGVLRELADGMAGQGRVLLEGDDFEELKAEAASVRARFRQPTGDFNATLKFLAAHPDLDKQSEAYRTLSSLANDAPISSRTC